jgi:hypothetical protein
MTVGEIKNELNRVKNEMVENELKRVNEEIEGIKTQYGDWIIKYVPDIVEDLYLDISGKKLLNATETKEFRKKSFRLRMEIESLNKLKYKEL